MKKQEKLIDITFPEKSIVHEHKESGAQWTTVPFVFPDAYYGTLVITKGMRIPHWNPSQEISHITIHYKD